MSNKLNLQNIIYNVIYPYFEWLKISSRLDKRKHLILTMVGPALSNEAIKYICLAENSSAYVGQM